MEEYINNNVGGDDDDLNNEDDDKEITPKKLRSNSRNINVSNKSHLTGGDGEDTVDIEE